MLAVLPFAFGEAISAIVIHARHSGEPRCGPPNAYCRSLDPTRADHTLSTAQSFAHPSQSGDCGVEMRTKYGMPPNSTELP